MLSECLELLQRLVNAAEDARAEERALLRRQRRRGLGPCDLLTIPEACQVLQMHKTRGRRFLHEQGLIHYFDGSPRVIAGELATCHARAAGGVSPPVPAPALSPPAPAGPKPPPATLVEVPLQRAGLGR